MLAPNLPIATVLLVGLPMPRRILDRHILEMAGIPVEGPPITLTVELAADLFCVLGASV